MSGQARGYDLFFCYSWKDKRAADALVARLRRERLNGRPLWVFQDDRELDDFDMITSEVNAALATSRCLVALYSENLPRSAYCRFELRVALSAAHTLDGTPQRVMAIPRNLDYEQIRPGRLTGLRLPHPRHATDEELVASIVARVAATDERTFGAAPPGGEPRWHPAPLLGTPRFVGRDFERWEVYDALHTSTDPGVGGAPLARITGLGGMGKTMLAEQYAREFADDYPGGVFVLRGFGSHRADRAVRHHVRARRSEQARALVQGLGTDVTGMDAAAVEAALRAHLDGERYLWIVDDLPAGLDPETFAAVIAPTPGGHTLITTRYLPDTPDYPWGGQVELGRLDDRAAMDLLTRDLDVRDRDERQAAEELAWLLGGYPLALAVASGLAARPGQGGYRGLRDAMHAPGPDALELGSSLWGDLPEGHAASIAATMLRSVEHLSAPGRSVLRALSLLAPAPVPQALIEGMMERSGAAGPAASGLADAASLAGVVSQAAAVSQGEGTDQQGPLWSAHGMVIRTMRFSDLEHESRERMRTAAVGELSDRVVRSRTIVSHRGLSDFLPHIHEVAATLKGDAEQHLVSEAGRVHTERGEFQRAVDCYQSLHEALSHTLGEDDAAVLRVEAGLGAAWGLLGDHERALRYKERAHGGLLARWGPHDLDVIMAENNLAVTHTDLGNHAEARAIYARVYRARRKLLGPRHEDTLRALSNYAIVVSREGRHRLALRLKRNVLALSRTALGEEHTVTLDMRNGVAASLQKLGEQAEAHRTLRLLYDDLERLLGPAHLDTLVVRESMAVIGTSKAEAAEHLEQVYLVTVHAVEPDHPIARRVLRRLLECSLPEDLLGPLRSRLGVAVDARGATAEDEVAFTVECALALQQARYDDLGPDHPRTAVATSLAAHALALQGPGLGAAELAHDAHTGLVEDYGSAAPWSRAAARIRTWVEERDAET